MSVARISSRTLARATAHGTSASHRPVALAIQKRFQSSTPKLQQSQSPKLEQKQTAKLEQSATAALKATTPQTTTIASTEFRPSAPVPLLPEFSLKDKCIIVTGGARGLGLTQAEAILEAGATVYCLDRLPEPSPEFETVQAKAKELGSTLVYRTVDVRDVAALNVIIEGIANDHNGRIDGLLAAAGIQQETPALQYTQADVEKMFNTNVTGVFMTAQAVARQMVKNGNEGSIALIASMSGTVANRGLICPAYNASKAAVIQLARNFASEWGEYGIRVNTISPGYIVTDMVKALFEQFPARQREWPKQNMLGKLSKPEDYRGAAIFLLSDASRFMTGADLRIDGGHSAW